MKNSQNGQVLIIAIIFLGILILISGSILGLSGQNVIATRNALAREQALQLAEAGLEKAVWQLNQTSGSYTGELGSVLGANTGEFDVLLTNISGNRKEITATGYVPTKANPRVTRIIKAEVEIGTVNVSFNYAMLVGPGGIFMKNNSKIHGGVYSNGAVEGANNARILSGDVYSSGSSGRIFGSLQIDASAYAHTVNSGVSVGGNIFGQVTDGITVGGNVFTNSLSNCAVGGNAHYTTISSCSVGGTQNPGYPGDPDPPTIAFPISDQQILDWKNTAAAGGVISGDYELEGSDTASLGPRKITGNLLVKNEAKLTITGALWIVGKVEIQNDADIILDPSYGDSSEVMISDGEIILKNESEFIKASPNSYVLVLTTSSSSSAFKIENDNNSMIAYAPNGTLVAKNDANLFQATANRVELENDVQLTYETGLANVNFSTTQGGGAWEIVRGTWRVID